ncbi:MAG: hypothetical protein RR135_00320 [Oscillospiraceae bacterium]
MLSRVKTSSSRSGLFLIELIIIIGFFAMASAVCIQIFARARLVAVNSGELVHASLAAQSAAEAFRATDGQVERSAALLAPASCCGGVLTQAFSNVWEAVDPAAPLQAPYQLTLTCVEQDGVTTADITVTRRTDVLAQTIYSLTVKVLTR